MKTFRLRRLLLGAPLHSGAAPHQRLNNLVALPVFSSDALSSVAYATQESMIALAVVGSAAFRITLPISAAIVILLVILTISYNQTIHAYPSGGGAYIVARDNLGVLASKVAAVALLTDYILTVAVSVASGIDAVLSAYPHYDILPIRLALNVVATLFIMQMNLRGVKESGAAFALPTYAFIISMLTLIGLGIWNWIQLHTFPHLDLLPTQVFTPEVVTQHVRVDGVIHAQRTIETLGLWVVLQAFASGCTALTGVEAISNGIPAFRAPESKNAAKTMQSMALILATMFLGVSFLAQKLAAMHHLVPSDSGETVISQIAHAVVGAGPFYFVIQWATFLILVLAANTSFADFPRLSAIAARDSHLPRWLSALGDRLVFQNGIIVLAMLAIILELAFKGSTDALIPLYAIGVFIAFTLSQAGMVARWLKLKSPGWRWRASLNGLGAVMTGIVALIFAIVKFSRGAWVVLLIMPLMVLLLTRIDKHYDFVRRRLRLSAYRPPRHPRVNYGLILIARLDEATRLAVEYARATCKEMSALHLVRNAEETEALQREWEKCAPGMRLTVANEETGGWPAALMDELYHLRTEDRTRLYTVILPRGLYPQGRGAANWRLSLRLKWMLLHEPGVVVADASSLLTAEERQALPTGVYQLNGGSKAHVPSGSGTLNLQPSSNGGTSLDRSSSRHDRHTILLLVPGMHRGIVEAIEYSRQLGRDVRALHIELEPARTEELRREWDHWAADIPLIIMESPYRQLREPLTRYVELTQRHLREHVLTVVVPEFVAGRWYDKALHNQSGLLLKFALQQQPNVVVVNTRYFLDR